MPAIYDHHHAIDAHEIDGLGHVNNLRYLYWMVDAALAHSAAQGWPTERYHAIRAGWVVQRHEIEYRRPAFPNEQVVVRTWVADMKRSTSLRRYQILLAGTETLLAIAATNWAFINFSTQKLARIPPEVGGAFEVVPDAVP